MAMRCGFTSVLVRRVVRIVVWGLVLALTLVCTSGMTARAADWETPSLPPFAMVSLRGAAVTRADLASGITVLAFAVPGTPSAAEAIPMLQEALRTEPSVRCVLLVPTENTSVHAMVDALDVDWPVLADEQFLLASVFQIFHVPALVGLVDGRWSDGLTWEFDSTELAAWLSQLVEDGTQSPVGDDAKPDMEDGRGPPLLGDAIGFYRLPEPLVLAFAGAHCPVCHEMLPQLVAIAAEYPVWLVITGVLDDPEPFTGEAPKLWRVLDPEWRLANLYDVHTTPTVFLVGQDGALIWGHVGFIQGLALAVDAFFADEARAEADP